MNDLWYIKNESVFHSQKASDFSAFVTKKSALKLIIFLLLTVKSVSELFSEKIGTESRISDFLPMHVFNR